MAYSSEIELCGEYLKLCACDILCEGLYRGSRMDYNTNRIIPFNKWLCECCRDDVEGDGGEIKKIRGQYPSDDQWDAWEIWYESLNEQS